MHLSVFRVPNQPHMYSELKNENAGTLEDLSSRLYFFKNILVSIFLVPVYI